LELAADCFIMVFRGSRSALPGVRRITSSVMTASSSSDDKSVFALMSSLKLIQVFPVGCERQDMKHPVSELPLQRRGYVRMKHCKAEKFGPLDGQRTNREL